MPTLAPQESQLGRPNKRRKYDEGPSPDSIKRIMKLKNEKLLGTAPSSIADHIGEYQNGEAAIILEADGTSIPIELMEEHFTKFHDYAQEEATTKSIKFLKELQAAACHNHIYEHSRVTALRKVLEKYMGDPMPEDAFPKSGHRDKNPYQVDGIARASFLAYVIRECKNEVLDKVNVFPQLLAYYAHYMADVNTHRPELGSKTRFPVLGILDTGMVIYLLMFAYLFMSYSRSSVASSCHDLGSGETLP